MASFNFESDSEQLAPLAPLTVSYPIIPDIPQDLKEEIQHLMWAFMQFLSSNSNSNTNTDNEVSRAKNIIFFIHNMHELVGVTDSHGQGMRYGIRAVLLSAVYPNDPHSKG